MAKTAAFCSLLLWASLGSCLGYPIVTCPTATMVPNKMAYLDYYWVQTKDRRPYAPDQVQIGAGYLGMTDRLELDVTSVKPGAARCATSLTTQYLVLAEKHSRPEIVIGLEDLTRELGQWVSFYAAAAANVTKMTPRGPKYPLVRLNLGYGTQPRSAWFGGIQIMTGPALCLLALTDGRDSICGFSLNVPKTDLRIRAGTLGEGRFVGAEYGVSFK